MRYIIVKNCLALLAALIFTAPSLWGMAKPSHEPYRSIQFMRDTLFVNTNGEIIFRTYVDGTDLDTPISTLKPEDISASNYPLFQRFNQYLVNKGLYQSAWEVSLPLANYSIQEQLENDAEDYYYILLYLSLKLNKYQRNNTALELYSSYHLTFDKETKEIIDVLIPILKGEEKVLELCPKIPLLLKHLSDSSLNMAKKELYNELIASLVKSAFNSNNTILISQFPHINLIPLNTHSLLSTVNSIANHLINNNKSDSALAYLHYFEGALSTKNPDYLERYTQMARWITRAYLTEQKFEDALIYWEHTKALERQFNSLKAKQLSTDHDILNRLKNPKSSGISLQEIYIFAVIALLALSMAAYSLYRLIRRKKEIKKEIRTLSLLDQEIEKEKTDINQYIENNSGIIKEKSLELRNVNSIITQITKELSELYNTKGQTSLMPSPELATRVQKIENDVSKVIRENSKIQNKHIFPKLLRINPNLSTTELKLASLITDNLSNSEIADALYISPNSVKVCKSRLKKKLYVPKQVELYDFLQNM